MRRRATVGRLYTAREDDDDDAAGIDIAGCDAVTAAFAAIAETEHLLFSKRRRSSASCPTRLFVS
jgi:hypothetical protein